MPHTNFKFKMIVVATVVATGQAIYLPHMSLNMPLEVAKAEAEKAEKAEKEGKIKK